MPNWNGKDKNARYGIDMERQAKQRPENIELLYSALVGEDGSHLDPLRRRRVRGL